MPREKQRAPKRVTVIGLGRFGRSLSQALHESGAEVTVIDTVPKLVEAASNHVTLAACGDATDEELLASLDVEHSDAAVVALGEAVEASLIATLLLKRLKVPYVIATAKSDLQADLLARVGADRIVFPEHDSAVRMARGLEAFSINDYLPLSLTSGVAKFSAPESFVGKTLKSVLADYDSRVCVLIIQRGDETVVNPAQEEVIHRADKLVIFGQDQVIERFIAFGQDRRDNR